MSSLQSILFKRSIWTEKEAKIWLKKYNKIPIKDVHKTKNFLRYRLSILDKNHSYRIIQIGKPEKGIEAVIKF